MRATLAFEIQNVLQVLDFFLQFRYESVICGAHLICTDLGHDFLGSIGEFESRDGLLRVVDDGTNSRNECRSGVAA